MPLWFLFLFVAFAGLATVIGIKFTQDQLTYSTNLAAIQGTRISRRGTWTLENKTVLIRSLSGDHRNAKFEIDVDHSPNQIEFWLEISHDNCHGIYSVEGDRLTLCLSNSGDPIPTSFNTKDDNQCLLIVFQRER